MQLQQDAANPEIWVNPQHDNGPGTYAVVIGVSRYPHLDDGDPNQKADTTYGLGQLKVSAVTAYDFLEWLGTRYRFQDVPVAKCWVLLAPTTDEQGSRPGMRDIPTPTFDRCRRAIRAWFHEMRGIHPATAERCRCVFFFSGHGLEVYQEQQVLLPCDYLQPGLGALNDAISTRNLRAGLGALAVPDQFFFVDACRNPPSDLKGAVLEGARILDEQTSRSSSPNRVAPVFYATTSGSEAWQPDSPDEGKSVFGGAVLEGLCAEVDMRPDCDATVCRVNVFPLAEFIGRRVRNLLRLPPHVRNPVRLGGDNTNICLTELDPPPVDRSGLATVERSRVRSADDAYRYSAADLPQSPLPPGGLHPQDTGADSLHDLLGSEAFTEMWEGVEARLLAPDQTSVPDRLTIHELSVDRAAGFRAEISFGEIGPHWLALPTLDGRRFVTRLPDDGSSGAPARYVLEFIRESDYSIKHGEVSLSPNNEGLLGEAARLWEDYREMHIDAATQGARRTFEEVLQRKLESPLAATVASLLLLRAREYDRLHDWLGNLTDWFSWLPDAPVLRALQLLDQQKTEASREEAVNRVLELEKRGLPYTGLALGYSALLTHAMLEEAGTDAATAIVGAAEGDMAYGAQYEDQDETMRRLERIDSQIENALKYFGDGGLFAMYCAPSDQIRPEAFLPLELGAI